MLRNILAGSRYMIIIAVIGTFLASLAILIYGGITTAKMMFQALTSSTFSYENAKYVAVECIEMIDLFLLGSILYIISLGLYELFIDDKLPTPGWLSISSLDDLKRRLLGVIIVLLAVSFLRYVVDWDGHNPILALGLATGVVILAIGSTLNSGIHIHWHPPTAETPEEPPER